MIIGALLNIDLYIKWLIFAPFYTIFNATLYCWFTIDCQKKNKKHCLLHSLTLARTVGFPAWPDCEIWVRDALFSMVNIISEGKRRLKVPQRFEDAGEDVLKGFLISSLVRKSWIPLCAVCLSQRGVNEWGMNNAGQDPIVWWRPTAAQSAAEETF